MLKLLVLLVALVGAFIAVAMLIAPTQPTLRTWYLENACSLIDKASTDVCAAMRREKA
jgi:multisubunit Na+/H+ antiporter MnhB subunit